MNAKIPVLHRVRDDDRPVNGHDAILTDALHGLALHPKRLPSKHFYDARGSGLFERICEQPEYYLTRVERRILTDHVDDIRARVGPGACLVEYGSGSGIKTRILLRNLDAPVAYMPVEIAPAALGASVAALTGEFPDLEILPVCADFTAPKTLPRPSRPPRSTVVFFPGSTIGNFERDEAQRLLARMRTEVSRGGSRKGGVLIGVDLVKDTALLDAAYNDAAGVTAAFTLNLLERLNREAGADFELASFHHRARYHAFAERIETHIVSDREQDVHVGGRTFHFAEGEPMLVEYSCKYTLAGFARLAARAGLDVEAVWTDPAQLFSVQWLTVA